MLRFALFAALLVSATTVQAQNELPLKLRPRPTKAAITVQDLMTRLYIFADDSMLGRQARTIGNVRGTNYIARELRKLGLEPAGDNGTYFQTVPFETLEFDTTSALTIRNTRLILWKDLIAYYYGGSVPTLNGLQAIYGGRMDDSTALITSEQAAGKLVFLVGGNSDPSVRFKDAAAIVWISKQPFNRELLTRLRSPRSQVAMPESPTGTKTTPISITITKDAFETIAGASQDSIAPGKTIGTVSGDLRILRAPSTDKPPARNVVAILRGADPALNKTYVAIGAHNDHVGIEKGTTDHDSLRLFRVELTRKWKAVSGSVTNENYSVIRDSIIKSIVVNVDSLRKLRPVRVDTINNGADDDGSGSVAVLEIAEALTKLPKKPKRSILFVFHTAEESGLLGAKYFTAAPTVPLDSIIALVNIDMIGRGSIEDTPEGGPNMVMAVGASRLSTELGQLIEVVNKDKGHNLRIDYTWDAPDHGQMIYSRSDHYEYAKRGIPIVFYLTGLHIDYHAVTDEPQYIDYKHLFKITNYIYDVMLALGNRKQRPVVDKHDLPAS